MGLILINRHQSISHFKHIRIIPSSRCGIAWEINLPIKNTNKGFISTLDIACGPPAITNRSSPDKRRFLTPIADGVKDWSSCLVESISHHWVSGLCCCSVIIAVIVFQIVNLPFGVCVGIDLFVTQTSRSSLACLKSCVTVKTEIKSFRVNIIG